MQVKSALDTGMYILIVVVSSTKDTIDMKAGLRFIFVTFPGIF